MRTANEIIEQCLRGYRNNHYGEITENMKFADLLEVYKQCELETGLYDTESKRNTIICTVNNLISAIIPTGCCVKETKAETIVTMVTNTPSKKISFVTVQNKMKHIKVAVGLYEKVIGKSLMLSLTPAFVFDMLPDYKKGETREERNKYTRELRKINKKEKESDCVKMNNNSEVRESVNRNNIIIVGVEREMPTMKSVKTGECFMVASDTSNNIYMKISSRSNLEFKPNSVCINDGTTKYIAKEVCIKRVKLDITAKIIDE